MTNVRVTQFYKTKTCPWYSKGRCERTNACRFAHNDVEKRKLPNLCKTSVCNFMVQNGYCDIPDCRYAHQLDELRATDGIYKTSLCFMFMKSRCDAGIYCRHAHGTQELRTPICPRVVRKTSAPSISENNVVQGVDMEKKTKKTKKTLRCVPFNHATCSNNTYLLREVLNEKVDHACFTEKAFLTPIKLKSHPIDFFVSSSQRNDPKDNVLSLNNRTEEMCSRSDRSRCSTPRRYHVAIEKDSETNEIKTIPYQKAFTTKMETLKAYPKQFEQSNLFSESMQVYNNDLKGLRKGNTQTHLIKTLFKQDSDNHMHDNILMSVENFEESFVENLKKSFYYDSQPVDLPEISLNEKKNESVQKSHLRTFGKETVYEKGENIKENLLPWDPFVDRNNDSAFFSFSLKNSTQEKNVSSYHLNNSHNPSCWTEESLTFEKIFNNPNQHAELFNETKNVYRWQYNSTCKSARESFENDFSTQCPSNNSCTSVLYETQGLCKELSQIGALHDSLVPVYDANDCNLSKKDEFFSFLSKNDSSTFCDSRQSSFSKKSFISQSDQSPKRKYGCIASKYSYFYNQLLT